MPCFCSRRASSTSSIDDFTNEDAQTRQLFPTAASSSASGQNPPFACDPFDAGKDSLSAGV
jgi:hypothetical protein